MLPSCSTTNSNSKPISALNSFISKYHCRISFTSVRAVQTRPTGALKVRSTISASAKSFVLVIMFSHLHLFGSIFPKALPTESCELSYHLVSPPPAAARPRRTCSRTFAEASSLPYSSCHLHHSYGGV